MSWAYASTADLIATLPELSALSTAALLRLLTGAARDIDHYCSPVGYRTFRVYSASEYFTPDSDCLSIPDLLTLTTLKQDLDGDRTYDTTWASTDYDLQPFNAAVTGEPYTAIEPSYAGSHRFWGVLGYRRRWPIGRYRPAVTAPARSVEIVAKWGYRETLESTGATLNGAIVSTSATTFTASDGTLLGIGQTILIDSEQMFVTGISSNTITVERGVNGTTAATHLDTTAISRYVYPSAVVDATFGYIRAMRGGAMAAIASGVSRRRAGDLEIEYGTRVTGDTGNAAFDFSPWLAGYRR